MTTWTRMLKNDPLPWLLEEDTPAIRHLALRRLLDQPEDAPDVRQAHVAAMQADPIAAILAAQRPDGFWVKPGPGYAPKYRGTVWQVIFLDQLGADGRDSRVQAACDYILSHSQAKTGGFAASGGKEKAAPPSSYPTFRSLIDSFCGKLVVWSPLKWRTPDDNSRNAISMNGSTTWGLWRACAKRLVLRRGWMLKTQAIANK